MSADVLGAPSAKEKKYDRQLRLWAANGQQALEEAHICLVNATAAGVEILKNLILPSIGQYTIIDNSKVTEADLGVNFFLEESSIGQDRAKATCELLQELNPDVKGNYIVEDFESLLSSPDRLRTFTVFIVTGDVPSDTLLRLDSILYPFNIPLFIVKSVGFTMSCRIVLKEHTIVESHPDDTIDLRLLSPFSELTDLYKRKTEHLCSNDKQLMSDHEFGHVPYVLILLKYLDNWKESHGGKYPETYKEKNEFKASIRKGMRTPDDENFEEAVSAVLKNLNIPGVPSCTKTIFEDEKCTNLAANTTGDNKTDNFWIIARAVKEFTYNDNGGLLPLPGALPDMKAESAGYIELQNVYKRKARTDADAVYTKVSELLKSLGREEGSISKDDVDTWCKHAAYVKLIRGRSLAAEYNTTNEGGSGSKAIANNVGDAASLIHFHLALRAYEDFTSKHKRPPGSGGSSTDDTSLDTEAMMETVRSIVKASIPPPTDNTEQEEVFIGEAEEAAEKAVGELVRAGGGEMHNISSFAGGVVAQEVIKAVTKQYILMDNTVVFDGISSRSEVFVL